MDGLLNQCGAESPAVSGYSVVQPIINPLLPPGIGNQLTTTVFNQHTSESSRYGLMWNLQPTQLQPSLEMSPKSSDGRDNSLGR